MKNKRENLVTLDGKSCPECGYSVAKDTAHCETYCIRCGLVVDAPYPYVSGFKIELPDDKE